MENLIVSTITNTLPDHTIVLNDDNGLEIILHPGERLSGMNRLTIPFIPEGGTLQGGFLRFFRTERAGEITNYTYTCKQGSGVVSALGPNMQDFLPPSNIHTSIPFVQPGETISVTFNIDEDNVTWIIGDIDSL